LGADIDLDLKFPSKKVSETVAAWQMANACSVAWAFGFFKIAKGLADYN
jgi:hypothetical protein